MRCEIIRQAKECPKHYADFLLRVGGKNPFGKPMFRLVWGPTATRTVWGQDEGGSCGQHFKLKYGPAPIWHLEMWKAPELFGTPEEWYEKSYDMQTGLHLCGDFPFEGDYSHHSRLNQVNYRILEELIPKIQDARNMTLEQRKKIIESRMEAERLEQARIVQDAYRDAAPAFGGIASSIESNHEAWEQRIIEKQNGFRVTSEQLNVARSGRFSSREDEMRWAKANPKMTQEEVDKFVLQN